MTRRAVKMHRGLGQLDALLRTGFMERQPGNEAASASSKELTAESYAIDYADREGAGYVVTFFAPAGGRRRRAASSGRG